MPLRTNTIDLDEAKDRLREERDQAAERQADAEPKTGAAQQAAQEGQQADRFLSGLAWFTAEYPECDELIFGALTNGERHFIQDIADGAASVGVYTNAYVAVATRKAPYLEHDPSEVPGNQAAVEQTVRAVADLHPAFVDWAEDRIGGVGRYDGGEMGKSYSNLVLEKRTRGT